MDFLAVLTHEHLDNGMFLTSFARSLAKKNRRGLIIHEDSEYTERIIQTGVMREDAIIRAIKELNHRLVALFADEGVAVIAVNGYQKSLVQAADHGLTVNTKQVRAFPGETNILLSNLAEYTEKARPHPVSIAQLASTLQSSFDIDKITLFSTSESSDIIRQGLPFDTVPANEQSEEKKNQIPAAFRNYSQHVQLTAPSLF